MTDFYAHFSNCKNYGDIYDTYMAYGGIVACAQTSVTMISCENYGNIWGKSDVKGQLIGWVRCVRSSEAIFIIDKCKGVVDSESAMLGNISSSDSGLNIVVKMNRCEIISLANTLSQYVLISASNGKVDLEVNNVYVESNLISGKINLFGAFSALTKAKIKNIILELNSKNETNVQAFVVDNKGTSQVEVEGVLILNNEKSCFFGDNFSGFYVDFRTGKISLKAMSFKGLYQGRVSEEFLKNKGYEKKVA